MIRELNLVWELNGLANVLKMSLLDSFPFMEQSFAKKEVNSQVDKSTSKSMQWGQIQEKGAVCLKCEWMTGDEAAHELHRLMLLVLHLMCLWIGGGSKIWGYTFWTPNVK